MKLDACWYSDEEWRGYVLHDEGATSSIVRDLHRMMNARTPNGSRGLGARRPFDGRRT